MHDHAFGQKFDDAVSGGELDPGINQPLDHADRSPLRADVWCHERDHIRFGHRFPRLHRKIRIQYRVNPTRLKAHLLSLLTMGGLPS